MGYFRRFLRNFQIMVGILHTMERKMMMHWAIYNGEREMMMYWDQVLHMLLIEEPFH